MNTFCELPGLDKFRNLQSKVPGLSQSNLRYKVIQYLKEHNGRWPQLDEMGGIDSSEGLRQNLHLSKLDSISAANLLEQTNTSTVAEAIQQLNNVYRDLLIDYSVIDDQVILSINNRPNPLDFKQTDLKTITKDSRIFIEQQLQKLAKCYGIQTISVTTNEAKEILGNIPQVSWASAFIYNGQIYVNSDIADIHSPTHELLHIFLGSIKFQQPNTYYNLVQTLQNNEQLIERARLYPNRSQMDVLEELFVEEYSKYLSGMPSSLNNLDQDTLYQLNYEVSRTIDTILMGDNSVRAMSKEIWSGQSLYNLGQMVNSSTMQNRFQSYIDDAALHRIIANAKEKLIERGELKEDCL